MALLLFNENEFQKYLRAKRAAELSKIREYIPIEAEPDSSDYFLDARRQQALTNKNSIILYFPWGGQQMHLLESK